MTIAATRTYRSLTDFASSPTDMYAFSRSTLLSRLLLATTIADQTRTSNIIVRRSRRYTIPRRRLDTTVDTSVERFFERQQMSTIMSWTDHRAVTHA